MDGCRAPKKRWTDAVYKDMKEMGVTTDDAHDRALWRSRTRTTDRANARDQREGEGEEEKGKEEVVSRKERISFNVMPILLVHPVYPRTTLLLNNVLYMYY
ncbi:hypothetical protein Y032_0416g1075 [Ancylostoma ceylanicum]|uniref:Uncharacterized protein n=1 Tax=Ancylostoma ceylanicum TaxID=53326 RepID=A0A016X3E7_9BILA|nr:hypothetical protein Y032_0416g1075 [Ancylostoma ceylanicum]